MCKDGGIPLVPQFGLSPGEIACNLKLVAEQVLEKIRPTYPNIKVNSGFRTEENNKKVGGAVSSRHLYGEAVDIGFNNFNHQQKYEAAIEIQKLLPDYDQILLEYRGPTSCWIHVSFKKTGNRRQIKTIDATPGGKTYNNKFVLLR
jgi:hypothetical protein